jgi:hypothetical protein
MDPHARRSVDCVHCRNSRSRPHHLHRSHASSPGQVERRHRSTIRAAPPVRLRANRIASPHASPRRQLRRTPTQPWLPIRRFQRHPSQVLRQHAVVDTGRRRKPGLDLLHQGGPARWPARTPDITTTDPARGSGRHSPRCRQPRGRQPPEDATAPTARSSGPNSFQSVPHCRRYSKPEPPRSHRPTRPAAAFRASTRPRARLRLASAETNQRHGRRPPRQARVLTALRPLPPTTRAGCRRSRRVATGTAQAYTGTAEPEPGRARTVGPPPGRSFGYLGAQAAGTQAPSDRWRPWRRPARAYSAPPPPEARRGHTGQP